MKGTLHSGIRPSSDETLLLSLLGTGWEQAWSCPHLARGRQLLGGPGKPHGGHVSRDTPRALATCHDHLSWPHTLWWQETKAISFLTQPKDKAASPDATCGFLWLLRNDFPHSGKACVSEGQLYSQMYPPTWALLLEGSPELSWEQDSAMGLWGALSEGATEDLCPYPVPPGPPVQAHDKY